MSKANAAQRYHALSDFDFDLPPELIAQHPAAQRADARLLDARDIAVDTNNADGWLRPPQDRVFGEFPSLLNAGDLLVFNDTKVIKARLLGSKPSGGSVELLVERVLGSGASHEVVAHMRASRKPRAGTVLAMQGGFSASLIDRWPDASGPLFRFSFSDDPYLLMQQYGHVPLPPYITRADSQDDETRYQTVFAKNPGAVAAPTAALHFDQATLAALDARGIQRANVTLHVGAGTFAPVKEQDLAHHLMHSEWYEVPLATSQALAQTRRRGGRVVAVGTTTVRALESWARTGTATGETNIFITPGFQFQWTDTLLTNFHLPKSTLMMLVSAFAGHQHVMRLYQHAIAKRYRFFSYGDAMLLSLLNHTPT